MPQARQRQRALLAPARRAVAPALDSVTTHRFATLAKRGSRARDADQVSRLTIDAFRALAKRVASGERTPRGFANAMAVALEGLHDHRTGASTAPDRLRAAIVEQFHRLFYYPSEPTWKDTYFLGVQLLKCPLDLWVYQELIHRIRPDVIIETGTKYGGSAYYMATICDLVGHGQVVTVDVEEQANRPQHPRITYIAGSSADPAVVREVDALIPQHASVLAVLDSDHSEAHVRQEMEIWGKRVTVGSYLVCEDTNVHHPVCLKRGPGPWEATADFLSSHGEYEVDLHCERYLMTLNPRGYLRRTR
jgi:cephalosporin hydroxylase